MAEITVLPSFSPFDDEHMGRINEATDRGEAINFGLVLPHKYTTEQRQQHDALLASLPAFELRGNYTAAERRYPLWAAGKKLLGRFLPYNWQQTGSCVGAGGGNMAKTNAAVEIVLKGEPEEYKELWWLYTYGMARLIMGDGGQGEGCTGPAYAEAALREGFFEADLPDLPKFELRDGWLVVPESVEFKWSAGRNIAESWRALGRKHLFKTAARIKSATDGVAALMNGYALTQASNFGFSNPKVKGTKNPVRIAKWNGSWSHQTPIDEYWDHEEVGPIVRWGNNWGPNAHGAPTGDEPPGGVYIELATFDAICKAGQVFAFSQFDGFPARELNFSAF